MRPQPRSGRERGSNRWLNQESCARGGVPSSCVRLVAEGSVTAAALVSAAHTLAMMPAATAPGGMESPDMRTLAQQKLYLRLYRRKRKRNAERAWPRCAASKKRPAAGSDPQGRRRTGLHGRGRRHCRMRPMGRELPWRLSREAMLGMAAFGSNCSLLQKRRDTPALHPNRSSPISAKRPSCSLDSTHSALIAACVFHSRRLSHLLEQCVPGHVGRHDWEKVSFPPPKCPVGDFCLDLS